MTALWLYAYVLMPALVVGMGYLAVRLHERQGAKARGGPEEPRP